MTNGRKGFIHEFDYTRETNEWGTPAVIFSALNLTFEMDPCAPPKEIRQRGLNYFVPTKRFLTVKHDGLSREWEGRVFVNPPYGGDTGKWLEKFVEHGDGVFLCYARTDTQWFQKYATSIEVFCFLNRRVSFVRMDGSQPHPAAAGSVLMSIGRRSNRALLESGLGTCLVNT